MNSLPIYNTKRDAIETAAARGWTAEFIATELDYPLSDVLDALERMDDLARRTDRAVPGCGLRRDSAA